MILTMSLGEIVHKRSRFRRDSNHRKATDGSTRLTLPLLEKQALVEKILRGEPISEITCEEIEGNDGQTLYLVKTGWAQLQAIFDFTDDKFRTWTAEEKRQWEQSHR